MSENTETQTPESTRTFYRSDYRKTAKLVQSFRHVKCDFSTAKPQASQDKADSMAVAIAQEFFLDAPEGAFSPEKFMAGTQLPQAQSYDSDKDDSTPEDTGSVLLDTLPASEGDIADEDLPEGTYEVE